MYQTTLQSLLFRHYLGDIYSDKYSVESLSHKEANEFREKLEPHIGKPISNELPEDSGAITGAYKKEEAKKWIAEYEKAMSEIPKEDN